MTRRELMYRLGIALLAIAFAPLPKIAEPVWTNISEIARFNPELLHSEFLAQSMTEFKVVITYRP